LVPRRLAVSARLPSLGVYHVRFRRKVRRKSIGAPRVGVRNPRVGVRNRALPGGLETTSRGRRYLHFASLFAFASLAPKSVDIYGHIYCHIGLRAGSNGEPLRGFVDYFQDGQNVLVDKAADGGITVAVILGPAVVRHP
jgi:hypothetical protein